MSPKTIQERVVQSLATLPYANVTVKVDVDIPRRNYLVEHPEGFPGIDVERKFLRRYPQHSLAAQLVGSVGEIDDPSSSSSASRASSRAPWSARAASSAPTTSTCAASTARPRSPSTRSGGPRARLRATTRCPGARCAPRSTSSCSRPARSTSTRRSTRARHRRRLRRARPAQRQRARAGLLPDGQPVDPLQADLAGHRRSALRRQRRRAAVQPRDRRLRIRRARPSSRSPRWRR